MAGATATDKWSLSTHKFFPYVYTFYLHTYSISIWIEARVELEKFSSGFFFLLKGPIYAFSKLSGFYYHFQKREFQYDAKICLWHANCIALEINGKSSIKYVWNYLRINFLFLWYYNQAYKIKSCFHLPKKSTNLNLKVRKKISINLSSVYTNALFILCMKISIWITFVCKIGAVLDNLYSIHAHCAVHTSNHASQTFDFHVFRKSYFCMQSTQSI